MAQYDDELIQRMLKNNNTWQEIADVFEVERENLRTYVRRQSWYDEHKKNNSNGYSEIDKKTQREDGSITSFIRVRRNEKKVLSEKELLEVHGFDTDEFKLKQVTSNEWTTPLSEEAFYNYQSKIVATPITDNDLTLEDIAELAKDVQSVKVNLMPDELPQQYLCVPLYDMHFGLNSLDDYQDLLNRLVDIIHNSYEEILIIVGGDYLQTDNMVNTTVKGTQLETVDFKKMVANGIEFIYSVVESALENSPNVKLAYLPGNHSSSNDYMVMQVLKARYPDLQIDDDIKQFKHAWLNNHAIFLHHGDKRKASNKITEVIVSEYAKEWGQADSRYLITGHLHFEKSLSNSGITHYQVMSPSKSSDYDKQQGYVTSERGLMLLEFNKYKRTAIYYI